MKPQLQKLEAHASHLLTAFIQLRERYALLHPMLFVEHVPKQYGSGRQYRGFLTLRNSLFLTCAQDVAKLSTDGDKRTPSIDKLITALHDPYLRKQLRKQFCESQGGYAEPEDDPGLLEAQRLMDKAEQVRQGLVFDALYAEATELWEAFSTSDLLKRFREVRDSITAHSEVRLSEGKYELVDLGSLGVKWADLKDVIARMQTLVERIGQLIRGAGFAWDSLDRQLNKIGADFWIESPNRVG